MGPIEFVASGAAELVLVATPRKIYAISPAHPEEFLRAFNRITELGSLTPLKSRSVYPVFLLARVWDDLLARALLSSGFFLGLALLVWVSLVIPTRASISLGFTSGSLPGEAGPPESLLLLPVLYGLSYLVTLLGGLYFYRRPDQQPIAYFLWAGNIMEVLFLLASIFAITRGA